jgi:hypothetical protein
MSRGGVRFHICGLEEELPETQWEKKQVLIDLHMRAILREAAAAEEMMELKLKPNGKLVLEHKKATSSLTLVETSTNELLLEQSGAEPLDYDVVLSIAHVVKRRLQILLGSYCRTEVFAVVE